MKLRNLLITAALFCLSANAFANLTWWDQNTETAFSNQSYINNTPGDK